MRIGVFGPGGVGGLLAGLVARAGHPVAVVARGEALASICARGLRVDSPPGVFAVPAEAGVSPAELTPVDAVLLCVKTWQVPEIAPSLGPWLAPGGFVVP